eukprot:jgi/Orpsp1_1/1187788/evm.model.d7180000060183.1
MENEFNKYAKNNNLDITLKLTALTLSSTTSYINNYNSMIETLLKKHSKKYDIFFYYGSYTTKYGPYFVDLEQYLSKEHIEKFDSNTLNKICIYNNKVVSLPVTLDIDALYSNKILLDKYNKTIPKTWEELINTSKYILSEERRLYNNTSLIAYNGLFN